MLRQNPHTPAHLFVDDTPYFITGAIYRQRPLLAATAQKEYLLELIRDFFGRHDWELHHWVVLDNHYHLLGKSRRGRDLPRIMRAIHSRSALDIRRATTGAKPIWWNYWDYCPRNQKEYLTRLNYLLNNPIKHGYVTSLYDYPFSSFSTIFAELGRDALAAQFRAYPDYKSLVLTEAEDDDF